MFRAMPVIATILSALQQFHIISLSWPLPQALLGSKQQPLATDTLPLSPHKHILILYYGEQLADFVEYAGSGTYLSPLQGNT